MNGSFNDHHNRQTGPRLDARSIQEGVEKDQRAPAAQPDPAIPCLALRPREAAKALGIGERKLWELTADRSSGIPFVRFGRAILYPVRELMDWLAEMAKEKKR